MKKIAFALFTIFYFPSVIFCQLYYGYARNIFLYQQPNARAEALGRSQVTLYGSPFTAMGNPASSAFSNGTDIEYSHMNPNYPFKTNGFYNTYGISCNTGKYGTFGFNFMSFSVGEAKENPGYSDINKNYLYELNYSLKVLNSLSLGINLNYYYDKLTDSNNRSRSIVFNSYYFDLGLLKQFSFGKSEDQNIFVGLSLINAGYMKAKRKYFDDTFPTIMHLGASYEFQTGKSRLHDLRILKLLLCTEYMDVFETGRFTQVKLGAEVGLFEILKLRAGNYSETLDTEISLGSISEIRQFTYGAGLELPLNKLTNSAVPLTVRIQNSI